MYVTGFQKRGLSHVHIFWVLESNEKLCNHEEYDSMVRLETPKLNYEPHLQEEVLKHMIHRPCDVINRKSSCMKDEQCKKRYPKKFLDETRQRSGSYLEYMRRFDELISIGRNKSCNNRYVVPYNHWLLLKHDYHINLEFFSNIKSIKYLY